MDNQRVLFNEPRYVFKEIKVQLLDTITKQISSFTIDNTSINVPERDNWEWSNDRLDYAIKTWVHLEARDRMCEENGVRKVGFNI